MRQFGTIEVEEPEGGRGGEFDVRAVFGVLRRHVRLIITTILLIVVTAGLVVFTLKPVYSASTLVLVDPSRKDLLDPEQQAAATNSDSSRVDSEVELIRAETTLMRAIQDANLIHDPEFGVKLGLRDRLLAFFHVAEPELPTGDQALQSVMDNLQNAVSIQRRGLTYVVSIQARSISPTNAARVANALADAYIKEQVEAKIGATLASRDIIQSRMKDASAAVASSEQAFDNYILENIASISAETGRSDLLDVRKELETTDAQRVASNSALQLAEASLQQHNWAAAAQNLKSEALSKLASDRDALQHAIDGVAQGSQQEISLRTELSKLEDQISSTANSELTATRQQLVAAQGHASELRAKLRSDILQTDLPAEVLTSIYGLQQDAELARTQYQTLLSRLHSLDAQAYLQVADSRIASVALAPSSPSFPNPLLTLVVAGIIGVAVGIGLAFLVENYVGGFTSGEQVQSVLRTRVAATLPRERIKGADGVHGISNIAGYVTRAPLSSFAEAIRRLRIGLDQVLRRQRPEPTEGLGYVIMVTSAAPNEGKTTISLSLARAYALSGRTTILIDCDLRRPTVHTQLGVEPSDGLLDYLKKGPDQGPDFDTLLTSDVGSGAYAIVGSRRSDISPDQLISGTTFSRLVQTARRNFDVVVLDTPPIGPVVDGLSLAPIPDVIVFVVRWTKTSQHDARSAVAALTEAKRPEIEIVAVLNQQEGRNSRYNYGYAAGYTTEPT